MSHKSMVRIGNQGGLALVTVLLIVTLIGTLQVFLVEQQHLLIRRISNQNAVEQGFQYAEGVNAWAMRVLVEDPDRGLDYRGEDWYRLGRPEEDLENNEFSLQTTSQAQAEKKPLPEVDFGFDGLQFTVVDLQGRYNLNNLLQREPQAAKVQKTIFLNLLEILEIGEFDQRESLYAALADWLDENDLARANGVESGGYQIKNLPYYAADQALASLGELRYVEGFSEKIIDRLRPYVTVLPISNARINLNTASAEVVSSLSSSPVTDIGPVAAFLSEREEAAFRGFQAADIQRAESAIIGVSALARTPLRNMLQIHSQYFSVNTQVTLGDYRFCMRTKVARPIANQTANVTAGTFVFAREYDSLCSQNELGEAV